MHCEKSDEPVVVSKSMLMNLGNKREGKTWMNMHLLHGLNTFQKRCLEAKGGTAVTVVRPIVLAYCNGMKTKES
jgi:hypothetical protein